MQYDGDMHSADSQERARTLYSEGYQRLTRLSTTSSSSSSSSSAPDHALSQSETKALEAYKHSRKSESERILAWINDALVWEELARTLFYSANDPSMALAALEYARYRGGGTSFELLLVAGRCHYRLHQSDLAQAYFEQALYLDHLNYYSRPIRFWLGCSSPAWAAHFHREHCGAIHFQRLYRGHSGRQRAIRCRHCRSMTWQRKCTCVAKMVLAGRAAQKRITTRRALEHAREVAEQTQMDIHDLLVHMRRWNAAASKIQTLRPIFVAKKEKQKRRQWMAAHRQLLEKVLRHSTDRYVHATWTSWSKTYIDDCRRRKAHAIHVIQSNVRRWLAWRRFKRGQAKEARQQQLVTSFLGQTAKRRIQMSFYTWRHMRAARQAYRLSKCIVLQAWWRACRARWKVRGMLQRQLRIQARMRDMVLARAIVSLYNSYHALVVHWTQARVRKNKAAKEIQRLVRGHLARTRVRKVRRRRQFCERQVTKFHRKRSMHCLREAWLAWLLYSEIVQREHAWAATNIQKVQCAC
jgi:hypothetical protein